jgi:uncharacterized protein YukE
MAKQFRVEPDELRGVAGHLDEVSSQIKEVMASLRAQIAGEGAGIACALAPGDAASFHAQFDHVQTTVDPADTSVLDYWADYLTRAANTFQQSDQGS